MATKTTPQNFFAGVGRRKTAVAQIRLTGGNGKFILNGQEAEMPTKIQKVLELTDRDGKVDISVIVRGGGLTSQVDATILGVARALVELNDDLRSTLRKAGFLTRDPRIKERKKPGLKGARKAPQWAKR